MTDNPYRPRLSKLGEVARHKVHAATPYLASQQLDAAAALLTEVYALGLRHRIRPQDWSAVASLPRECVDALAQRDPLAALRKRAPEPGTPEHHLSRTPGEER
jgi:hypothetical protein